MPHPSSCLWLLPPCNRRCERLSLCWPAGYSGTSPAGLREAAEGKEENEEKRSLVWYHVFSRLSTKDTGVDVGPDNVSGHVKVEFDEFALRTEEWTTVTATATTERTGSQHAAIGCMTHKSRGVVVLDGLCVSKSLQDGVSLQELLL